MECKTCAANLINALSDKERIRKKLRNQLVTFDLPERSFLLLHSGIASLYRSSDDLLISNIEAPSVLGLNFYITEQPFYIRANTDISYEWGSLDRAKELIISNNLWETLAKYQMWMSFNMINYMDKMAGTPTRKLILYCLEQLKAEPRGLQQKMTAADYILDKTNLSRSTVMKTLAILRDEGVITLRKGLIQ